MPSIELRPLPPGAAGELLALQRAAHVPEAQLYDDVRLPALVWPLDELADELTRSSCLGARAGSRLVGAVRAHERDGVLHVGRLVVAPDLQGRGIGTRLLPAAEHGTRLPRATLFTGARSTADLRLSRRHGCVDAHRETVRPGLQLVHLVEELR
ncbi:GNAT family N-acetyltransferase [Geodermatophilus poikilotrophus]|uniref:Acetyltransferase (GNAT) family protein n=1 Tax=Geodermatophilus poikilotrophus TaxID=1333667 RepID=A0A1I0H5I4_9ACTN|nr:GNAT family N-acetyltransferase [Geodermatophilus poikilotrophus]SET78848.1 Acetyltransferase (GNAT) family protein [Geodermatophilus poikilotrophus]